MKEVIEIQEYNQKTDNNKNRNYSRTIRQLRYKESTGTQKLKGKKVQEQYDDTYHHFLEEKKIYASTLVLDPTNMH